MLSVWTGLWGDRVYEAPLSDHPAKPEDVPAAGRPGFLSGLRGRLLLLTTAFVLFAVLLIYPPLAAIYRTGWLQERTQAAQIAALAVDAAPDGRVSEELSRQLLEQAQVISVSVQGADFRELVLPPSAPISGPLVRLDMRDEAGPGGMWSPLKHLFAPEGRYLQIVLEPSMTSPADAGAVEMEVIVPEAALKQGLVGFSRTLLIASIIISGIVGALVYFAVFRLVVRPMQRLTNTVIRFSETPESADVPVARGGSDEIRRANAALEAMQKTVSAAFRQRKRLAELGEAVAKINHDLRNSLAAAQIVSEGLAQSDDPRVKRAAPRLERAIERAISLAEATLSYGRAEPSLPRLNAVNILPAVEEAAAEGLAGCDDIVWRLEAAGPVMALADPEHVHRIIANLVRNAARAIKEQTGRGDPGRITARAIRQGEQVTVEVSDNGPGVPQRVMGKLFQPFAISGSPGGAGLGLAIARELARGMNGDLELTTSGADGATFMVRLPAA